MGTLKLRKWDTVDYLKTDEDMVMYLEACMEEAGDDAVFIAAALGDIARAKGMTQLARAGHQTASRNRPRLICRLKCSESGGHAKFSAVNIA